MNAPKIISTGDGSAFGSDVSVSGMAMHVYPTPTPTPDVKP